MKLVRGLMLATACASFVATTACDKAKDALKEALGVDQVEGAELDAILSEAMWNKDDPRLKDFEILGAIKITEKFGGDLSTTVDIPVPPIQGADKAGDKVPSIALLKKLTFTVGTKADGSPNTLTRFKIVSIGRYDAETSSLKVDGDMVNQYLDEAQKLSKANQAEDGGVYVLVKGKGGGAGFAYLKGTTTVKKASGETANVGGALVFTSGSPFVAESGASSGQYFLAMLDGDKGTVTGFKRGFGSEVTGAPDTASTEIPYAGLLDQIPEVAAKAEEAEAAGLPAKDMYAKANKVVTDFGAQYGLGWTLVDANLVWTQPPQEPAANPPPKEIPPKSKDDVKETDTDTSTSTDTDTDTDTSTSTETDTDTDSSTDTDTEVVDGERSVSDDGSVMRGEEGDPQVDLGCNGFYLMDDGSTESSFIYDGSKFADSTVKGWRFQGDARPSSEGYFSIFGSIEDIAEQSGGRYLDEFGSACVLTTGDQMYQMTQDMIFMPGPDGAGKASEMWQQVKVPADAKAIQIRVAFLSQEYPKYVGTKFNDSFFIKFDEAVDYIAAGNLNEIAGEGKTDASGAPIDISTCKSQTGPQLSNCGDWQPVVAGDEFNGSLFNIAQSTQAQKKGVEFGAITEAWKTENDGHGQAYYGMVPPRIICKNLTEEQKGATLTLRFNVTDAGDNLFDSALAVDSVVFTKAGCDEDTFTGEEDSRVNEL